MLMMAGSQAKQNKIKTPRGQAWPAETQSKEATSEDPANRQRARGPAHRLECNQHRRIEKGDQRVMTTTAMIQAETLTLARSRLRRRSQPSSETSGMRMRKP